MIDLKQDFWSILGQMTNFARGRRFRKVSMHSIKDIPVAMGTTKADETEGTPERQNQLLFSHKFIPTIRSLPKFHYHILPFSSIFSHILPYLTSLINLTICSHINIPVVEWVLVPGIWISTNQTMSWNEKQTGNTVKFYPIGEEHLLPWRWWVSSWCSNQLPLAECLWCLQISLFHVRT